MIIHKYIRYLLCPFCVRAFASLYRSDDVWEGSQSKEKREKMSKRSHGGREVSGRGGGGGRGSGRGGGGIGVGGISASTVHEELRIRFTTQLRQLRESEVTEVIFPSNLTNIERKFLHKVAQDLGLKSKSKGKGDDRYITVTKKEIGMKEKDIFYQLKSSSMSLLNHIFSSLPNILLNSVMKNRMNYSRPPREQSITSQPNPDFYFFKQETRLRNPSYQIFQSNREKLPSYSHKDLVISLVKEHSIVLISGETGCGKTTQVPQFIFDDPEIGPFCKIAVTQPRRLSAMTVSERIAAERGEQVGDVVGYNIRLESECHQNTRIHFMTPGVLVRILQTDPGLNEWTHIIIDEAHERDRYTEFLFILLRDLIASPLAKKPKLILMSATMHIDKLSNYFGDIPHVHIGSSRYPVEEFYLESVLRFVGFSKKDSLGPNSKLSTSADLIDQPKTYKCPICNSSRRIFYSSVELGTHVALCNGRDDSESTLVPTLEGSHVIEIDDAEENYEEPENAFSSDDDEVLITEDPAIISEILGESSFAQAASRLTISHSDDELLKQYQQSWDDSMVDIDLIHSLLKYIFRSEFSRDHGVVLVFLPGWDDISRLKNLLLSDETFSNPSRFRVLALHSGISKQAQKEVFQPVPASVFKIVLSTNIAETSVTIDNVTVVIDSGRSKEKLYDPHVKLSSLKEDWISQSSANQRRGRAGRTRTGVCFRLYSSRRYGALPSHQDSELVRSSLEELVLTIKTMGLALGQGHDPNGIYNFLSKAMDPPHPLSITNALSSLTTLKCLDQQETITSLGRVVAQLPMDPFLSRALILSALFGVLPSMIRLACAISYRDPFVIPANEHQRGLLKKVKASLSRGITSDQLTVFYAIAEYEAIIKRGGNAQHLHQFCESHFLSKSTMSFLLELEKQIQWCLESSTGISIKQPFTTRYERSERKCIPLLCSLVGIGLFSTVAVRTVGTSNYLTEKGCKAKVHPSSVNRKQGNDSSQCVNSIEMIVYQELVTAPASLVPGAVALLMISTCPVSLYTYLLSCGTIETLPSVFGEDSSDDEGQIPEGEAKEETVRILIDGWLKLTIPISNFDVISQSRSSLNHVLTHYLESPSHQITEDHLSRITAITDALVFESVFHQTLPMNHSTPVESRYQPPQTSRAGPTTAKNPRMFSGKR